MQKKNYDCHMPYRYYLLYSRKFSTVFFMLDSNTFLWDYYQRLWLKQVYNWANIEKIRNKILVQYHPLQSSGIFSTEDNIELYLPEGPAFNNAGIMIDNNIPLGEQIGAFFKENKIAFDLVYCAYDNFLGVFQSLNQRIKDVNGFIKCIIKDSILSIHYINSFNNEQIFQLYFSFANKHQHLIGSLGAGMSTTLKRGLFQRSDEFGGVFFREFCQLNDDPIYNNILSKENMSELEDIYTHGGVCRFLF